jgi:hypothetical protein
MIAFEKYPAPGRSPALLRGLVTLAAALACSTAAADV